MAEEPGLIDLSDTVAKKITNKMIERHPALFLVIQNPLQVKWENQKTLKANESNKGTGMPL